MNELDRLTRQRSYRVALFGLLCAAVIGFFTGTRSSEPKPSGYGESGTAVASHAARSYAELRDRPQHQNQELYTSSLAVLRNAIPKPTDPVSQPPGSLESAIQARAALRAYEGAPPLVPHAVDQRAQPNCVACHEHGAMIGDKLAPAMSHGFLTNCVQCHAAKDSPPALKSATLSEIPNAFAAQPPQRGVRAWEGAPPVMPHTTWMRERCGSCHGVTGKTGIRSTHPERQNCQQCHAPQATLDQRFSLALVRTERTKP